MQPPSPCAPGVMLALAPMQGITDAIVREQLSSLGGMDYCVTEFIRVSSAPITDTLLLARCPELPHGCRTPSGTPVHVQLLGSDPDRMGVVASRLCGLGARVIDLNFGCPVRRVNGHGGGAALLRDPSRIQEITSAVRRVLPPSVAVSAKLRLGWDNPDDVVAIARAAEDGGAQFVTIHGRTRSQGYEDSADWERIGLAASKLSIPVVANGDIRTPEDMDRCHQLSGCVRFLLGRGLIARLELLRVLRGWEPSFWPWRERLQLVLRFIEERRSGNEPESYSLGRLKGWCIEMAKHEAEIRPLCQQVCHCPTLADAVGRIRGYTPGDTPGLPASG